MLSNIRDVDNSIPVNVEEARLRCFRMCDGQPSCLTSSAVGLPVGAMSTTTPLAQTHQHSETCSYGHRVSSNCNVSASTISSVNGRNNTRNELLAVLNELRFITRKIKDDTAAAEEMGDWKFAAMVIDRLFFWVFTAMFVVTTIAIFFSAPNLFG